MTIETFNTIVHAQIDTCTNMLTGKGLEYAPDAAKEKGPELAPLGYEKISATNTADRLAHFKKAAAIMGTTPKAALLDMFSKHIVSVSDMCTDNRDYPIEKWDEKITDSINYLLILRAIVEEEQHG